MRRSARARAAESKAFGFWRAAAGCSALMHLPGGTSSRLLVLCTDRWGTRPSSGVLVEQRIAWGWRQAP